MCFFRFIRYCQIAFLIYVLASSIWMNLCLHIFTNMWCFPTENFFNGRWKIVFYFVFPHYYWSWVSSYFSLYVLLITCISSINCLFNLMSNFKNWVVFFFLILLRHSFSFEPNWWHMCRSKISNAPTAPTKHSSYWVLTHWVGLSVNFVSLLCLFLKVSPNPKIVNILPYFITIFL